MPGSAARAVAVRQLAHPVRDRREERQRPERRDVVGGVHRRGGQAARGQQAQQARELAAQLGTRHDPVDEPVAVQELGALEALRQLGGDRAGRDPRAGESDEGIRLGDVHVADRREGGEHAAGRRVRQDRDERDAGRAQPLERRQGLGQLHQRQRPFLHPRPARGADDQQRHAGLEGVLGGAGHLLADDRAHRAAHEPEVHDAHGELGAAHRAGSPDGGVPHAGRELGGAQAVGIRLLIHEARGHRPTGARDRAPPTSRGRAAARGARRPTGGSGARRSRTPEGSSRAAC